MVIVVLFGGVNYADMSCLVVCQLVFQKKVLFFPRLTVAEALGLHKMCKVIRRGFACN